MKYGALLCSVEVTFAARSWSGWLELTIEREGTYINHYRTLLGRAREHQWLEEGAAMSGASGRASRVLCQLNSERTNSSSLGEKKSR